MATARALGWAATHAKSQLLGFLGTDNGNTVEERFVLAIAAVSFPDVQLDFAARVINSVIGS
jgi:hypothetical protein